METTETKTALLVALASALTALGWKARIYQTLLDVEGFPRLPHPEVRFHASGATLVWNGYSAKNPETMAKRIAKFLESSAAESKAAEAAKVSPLYLNAAEVATLRVALACRRSELEEFRAGGHVTGKAMTPEIEALSALLAKLTEMGREPRAIGSASDPVAKEAAFRSGEGK